MISLFEFIVFVLCVIYCLFQKRKKGRGNKYGKKDEGKKKKKSLKRKGTNKLNYFFFLCATQEPSDTLVGSGLLIVAGIWSK